MIMQGGDDQTVPPTQSTAMAAKLISCGVDCTFSPFAGGHDLSKLSMSDQTKIEMTGLRWFVSKLRP
jgi:predicted esterase